MRVVGCLTVLDALALIVFYRPDWIVTFLQGPKIDNIRRKTTPWQMQDENNKKNGDAPPYRDPVAPRPAREKIFKALSNKEQQTLKQMKQTFEHLEETPGKLIPCRLDGDCFEPATTTTSFTRFFFGWSFRRNSKILLRNSLEMDRYWCGKRIMGGGGTLDLTNVIKQDPQCREEVLSYVHLNRPPDLSGKGMPSVDLFWNFDEVYDSPDFKVFSSCSVPCRSTGDYAVVSTINVRNTIWEITFSMEGEKYYSETHVRPAAYRENRFYATTSFQSEIPVPYYSRAEYDIQKPPVDWSSAIKGASFLANNCDSLSHREKVVNDLIASPLRVDSLSTCLHNADPPNGVDLANKINVMRQYLFHLAFENQRADDYITEKLWGSLEAGTLPVYFGASNVKEHVPARSIIVVDDFDSVSALAQYLVQLTKDKTLYDSYHAWRGQPELDDVFRTKYEFTNTHSTCRLCKWAFAKRHGLGWNHSKQDIVEPFIPQMTCRNKIGLVGHPFKEYWLSNGDNAATEVGVSSSESTKTCQLSDANRAIAIDHGALGRKIFDHDGVTDLLIDYSQSTTSSGSYLLKLETRIVATQLHEDEAQQKGKTEGSVHWIQDSQSRMTFMTRPKVSVSIGGQGTVQFVITSDTRIRVVVENVDHFHKGTKKQTSYFANLMEQDFFTPLAAYKVH